MSAQLPTGMQEQNKLHPVRLPLRARSLRAQERETAHAELGVRPLRVVEPNEPLEHILHGQAAAGQPPKRHGRVGHVAVTSSHAVGVGPRVQPPGLLRLLQRRKAQQGPSPLEFPLWGEPPRRRFQVVAAEGAVGQPKAQVAAVARAQGVEA